MTSFRVTPRAFEDLKTIGRYTQRKWGRQQRDTYLRDLDARFAWLAKQGYRSFRHEAHVIFYQIRADGIDIIGVPHQAMDIAARLGTETD